MCPMSLLIPNSPSLRPKTEPDFALYLGFRFFAKASQLASLFATQDGASVH